MALRSEYYGMRHKNRRKNAISNFPTKCIRCCKKVVEKEFTPTIFTTNNKNIDVFYYLCLECADVFTNDEKRSVELTAIRNLI